MTRRTWAGRSLLGLVAAGLALLLGSSGAYAAVPERFSIAGCQGSGCDGQWPRQMGCASGSVAIAWMTIVWDLPEDPFMKGSGALRYSPQCHAVYAEFTMTTILDPNKFIPQMWVEDQYGGSKRIGISAVGFQPVDGVLDGSNPEIVQSQLLDWSYSVRLCLHENLDDIYYDPDADIPPSSANIQCTDWQ
jgi:hypothetical protein